MAKSINFGIVTKSDHNFFPGLFALLNSLTAQFPELIITVLDCGLTDLQRSICLSYNVSIDKIDLTDFNIKRNVDQGKFTPSIYGFLKADFERYDVLVHLDADTLVLGSLDEIIMAAMEHGCAAVPDHPALDLSFQIGEEGALEEVKKVIPNLNTDSVSFNAGVIAIRSDYYLQKMVETVENLIPIHTRLWGNDQAILNLAAFQANPENPFQDVGRRFNTRPWYRRDKTIPALEVYQTPAGPGLIEKGEEVRVLHFVGRPKPWEEGFPKTNSAYYVWNHYSKTNLT